MIRFHCIFLISSMLIRDLFIPLLPPQVTFWWVSARGSPSVPRVPSWLESVSHCRTPSKGTAVRSGGGVLKRQETTSLWRGCVRPNRKPLVHVLGIPWCMMGNIVVRGWRDVVSPCNSTRRRHRRRLSSFVLSFSAAT